MTWRRNQQVALAVTPKIASIFSFAGSTWIIVEVCTSKTKRTHPYHRLLLAMSLYDVVGSISFFMSTWPIPASQSNDQQVWTVGTTQTCSAEGFFVQLGVAIPIYNALLALYFLLVVNYNISDRTLRTRVEPAMHVTAFVWGFGTALSSTLLGLFNNANLWCWIAPYPSDCKDSRTYGDEGNCIRGDNAWIYRWAFYFAPLWFCILVATICTFLMYRSVKTLDQRTLRYRRPERILGETMSRDERESSISVDLAAEEQKDDDFLSGNKTTNSAQQEDEGLPRRILERWKVRRAIYRDDYMRSVEVADQALFYLVVYYFTHVWSTTNRLIQQLMQGESYFALLLCHAWMTPFQGFLNFLVYQRQRYLKIRKSKPSRSRLRVAWRALRFSYLPPINKKRSSPIIVNETEPNFSELSTPAAMGKQVQSESGTGPGRAEDESGNGADRGS